MAGWEDLAPKAEASSGGWEDLAPKKPVEASSELPSHPGGEALVLPKMAANMLYSGVRQARQFASDKLSGLDTEQTLRDTAAIAGDTPDILKPYGKEEAAATEGISNLYGKAIDLVKGASRTGSNLLRMGKVLSGNGEPETDAERYKRENIAEASGEIMGQLAPMAFGGGKATERVSPRALERKRLAERAIQAGGWEDLIKGEEEKVQERQNTDMGAQARDEGQIQPSENNPYHIDPQTQAAIEEAHNPTNAPETRVEGQGELFTGQQALTPDELAQRRFVTSRDVPDKTVRDIEEPTQTNPDRNLGVEDQQRRDLDPFNPVETQQPLGFGGPDSQVRDASGIPYKEHIPASQVAQRLEQQRRQEALRKVDPNNPTIPQQQQALDARIENKTSVATPAAKESAERTIQSYESNERVLKARIERMERGDFSGTSANPKNPPLQQLKQHKESLVELQEEKQYWQQHLDDINKTLAQPKATVRQFVPLKQRGAIGDWSKRVDKGVAKQGLASTLMEEKKQLLRETRPLTQIVKSGEIDPKTIQDLGLQGKLTNVLVDKSISILAQSKTGLGRIVKWAQDNREHITREKDIRIEKGVDELLTPWRKLTKPWYDTPGRISERRALHNDLREMKDVWHDNVGGDELTRNHFKNDRQWEMFKQSHEFVERKFNEWNDKRAEAGLRSFNHVSNYFPAIWEGDYRVWIKDGSGNNVGVRGFKNIAQAKLAQRFIAKEHPDYVVENPVHIDKQEDYHDLSAFEEAMRLNSKDFKAFSDLRKTYSRLMRQKGYGAHGLHRQNLFGYLGMEKGNVGLKNSERALEIWIRRGETHVANIDMSKLQSDLHNDLPMEVQAKIPQAMEYLDDYLGNARGVHIYKGLRIVDKEFQNLGKAVGFGGSAAARTLSNVTSVGSVFKIFTPKFLAASVLQPFSVLWKLRQLNIRLPESANFAESWLHGYQGALWPDKTQMEMVKWAGEQQHLSSAVVEMMKMRQSDLATASGSRMLDSARFVLSQTEKHLVRIPALLAFEHLLRKDFPVKEERFQAAADHLYYVVNYGHESAPLGYAKLGIAGDAARPMKQFSHNYYGQLLEAIQGAKNKSEFSPLGMFLAQQATLSGLRGVIGFAEATAFVVAVNNIFGTNWTTPEEWVMKSGLSDWVTFGAPSKLLGKDISSSVNSPNLPQMMSYFPLEFGIDAVKNVGHYIVQTAKGMATKNDLMAALISSTPNAARGYIEEMFSEPGEPVPHPGAMNMQGTYVRTDGEKTAAKLFSLKGLEESRKDAEMRTFKQMFARMGEQRLEAIDVISDRVMQGQDLPDSLIQQYMDEGGQISNLSRDIKQRLKGRMLPFEDKQLIGPMTPQKLKKLEIMKDALDRQTGGSGSGGGGGERDDFNTKLTPVEEKQFQQWKSKYAPRDSGFDYDMRGAFKAGLTPDPQTGHWPDTFKKPNHPTFSDESQYASYGSPGKWTGPNHDIFQPGIQRDSADKVELLNKSPDRKAMAQIRAAEAGNDPAKIQAKIDLYTNALRSAQGTKRHMIRSEIKELESTKSYMKKMRWDDGKVEDRPDNGVDPYGPSQRPPDANDQNAMQDRGGTATMPQVAETREPPTRQEQLEAMRFEQARRLQLLRRKNGTST